VADRAYEEQAGRAVELHHEVHEEVPLAEQRDAIFSTVYCTPMASRTLAGTVDSSEPESMSMSIRRVRFAPKVLALTTGRHASSVAAPGPLGRNTLYANFI